MWGRGGDEPAPWLPAAGCGGSPAGADSGSACGPALSVFQSLSWGQLDISELPPLPV